MTKKVKESELEEECGVTDISLKRALYFKQNGWKLLKINISGKDTSDMKVNAVFSKRYTPSDFPAYRHYDFTGFSIGYGGIAPTGFKQFLEMFEVGWDFNPFTSKIKDGPYSWSE